MQITTDWASGVYLAKLTGTTTGKQSYIIFVVRDDARSASALFQTSVTTYAAYNNWGGYDFYDVHSNGLIPANKVSFDRPYSNPASHMNGKGAGDFLSWEINMLRFIEREGFDVKYSTNIDTHTSPSILLGQRMFMSVGHDEYYTKQMYDAVEAARNAGVNLGFFGANNIYWQIRLEPNSLTGRANRTVVGYKYATDPIESTNPTLATYRWRSSPINRPEAALIGIMYDYNTVFSDIVIADCTSWVCAGTSLSTGSVLTGLLGYEVDKIAASSPSPLTVIASSPYDACLNANCSSTERRYANVSLYTAASGASVFATGSMQWNWGLDSFTPGLPAGRDDEHPDRANADAQQITRNVLNRFTAAGGTDAPSITSTPLTSATVGVAYSYDVNASDPNGDTLTYALTQAPAGMTINASSGLIAWTPTATQTGNQSVTVRVSDPGGLFATQSFTISVGSGGGAPSSTRVDLATPSSYNASPSGTVAITLNWYRIPMADNYLQFMFLQNAAGQKWSVDDHETNSATWASGPVTETRTITLPSTLPTGTYDIRVGLAGGDPWTDQTLVMGSGATDPGNSHRYVVGTLTVP